MFFHKKENGTIVFISFKEIERSTANSLLDWEYNLDFNFIKSDNHYSYKIFGESDVSLGKVDFKSGQYGKLKYYYVEFESKFTNWDMVINEHQQINKNHLKDLPFFKQLI